MTKSKAAKARSRQIRGQQGRSGVGAIETSQTVRTVSLVSVNHVIIPCVEAVDERYVMGNADWSVLKSRLDHCQEWRIRSLRVTVDSLPADKSNHMIGMLVEPRSWKPSDWASLKGMGGIIRSSKSQGWSSNTIGAQDEWVKFDARAASLFFACPGAVKDDGSKFIVTAHMTIQLRGFR